MTGDLQTIAQLLGGSVDAFESLPSPVKRNIFKAMNTLIAGIIDVPIAYLEMKAGEFKIKAQGHKNIMLAVAGKVAENVSKDPKILDRALSYFANNLAKEQSNRESVARETLKALEESAIKVSDMAKNEIPNIDDDWLDIFRRLASTKSNGDIQAILGRILANEAWHPNTISPVTLDVVSKLDKSTAQLFEYVVNCSIIIPDQPDLIFSRIISADMVSKETLIVHPWLLHLQSYSLIHPNPGIGFNIQYFHNIPPCQLGGQTVLFGKCERDTDPNSGFYPPDNGNIWSLSVAGMQLAPLMVKTFNRTYARLLRGGMERLGISVTFPDIDLDKDE